MDLSQQNRLLNEFRLLLQHIWPLAIFQVGKNSSSSLFFGEEKLMSLLREIFELKTSNEEVFQGLTENNQKQSRIIEKIRSKMLTDFIQGRVSSQGSSLSLRRLIFMEGTTQTSSGAALEIFPSIALVWATSSGDFPENTKLCLENLSRGKTRLFHPRITNREMPTVEQKGRQYFVEKTTLGRFQERNVEKALLYYFNARLKNDPERTLSLLCPIAENLSPEKNTLAKTPVDKISVSASQVKEAYRLGDKKQELEIQRKYEEFMVFADGAQMLHLADQACDLLVSILPEVSEERISPENARATEVLMHLSARRHAIRSFLYGLAFYFDCRDFADATKSIYFKELADVFLPLAQAFIPKASLKIIRTGNQILENFPEKQEKMWILETDANFIIGRSSVQRLDSEIRFYNLLTTDQEILKSLLEFLVGVDETVPQAYSLKEACLIWRDYVSGWLLAVDALKNQSKNTPPSHTELSALTELSFEIFCGFHLLKQALAAEKLIEDSEINIANQSESSEQYQQYQLYHQKILCAEDFMTWVLPRQDGNLKLLEKAAAPPLDQCLDEKQEEDNDDVFFGDEQDEDLYT